jgi:8-oxo-dGTP pyrophosphatase MutT (NUDIX family)
MTAPQLIHREVVYRGKIITVHRDTLRQPDGGTAVREVVDHPDSVAVVALDPQDRVLLVRQYRHPVGGYLWELPAGLLDRPGEPALDAARRELAEETGTTARLWHTLVELHTSPGMTSERVQVFLARDLHPAAGEHERDADEGDIATEWVPLDEAVRRVRTGAITNGLAVAGLLAAAQSRATDFTDLRPAGPS